MPVSFGVRDEWRVYYIVFQPSTLHRIWSAFCPDLAFRHCWLIQTAYMGEPGLLTPKICMKIESLANMIDTEVWNATPEEIVEGFLPRVTDILRISLRIKSGRGYIPRGITTCVSVPKAVMGIKAWWILTPKQLYNYLLSIGAVSLNEEK